MAELCSSYFPSAVLAIFAPAKSIWWWGNFPATGAGASAAAANEQKLLGYLC